MAFFPKVNLNVHHYKIDYDEYKEMGIRLLVGLHFILFPIGSCIACNPIFSKRECSCFFVTGGDAL